jgi:hypothetical protein
LQKAPKAVGLVSAKASERYCGATLIGSRTVLVSAHCVADGGATYEVVLNGAVFGVIKVIRHPAFAGAAANTAAAVGSDIALLQLNQAPPGISPLPLSAAAPQVDGTLQIAGPGDKPNSFAPPAVVLDVGARVIGAQAGSFRFAGGTARSAGCVDAGEALLVETAQGLALAGVLASGCATSGYGTRLDDKIAWISTEAGGDVTTVGGASPPGPQSDAGAPPPAAPDSGAPTNPPPPSADAGAPTNPGTPGPNPDAGMTTNPGTPDAGSPPLPPPPTSFSDVPANHWAASSIATVVQRGWMEGCAGQAFCPDTALSRAHAARSLVRVGHGDSFPYDPAPHFSDVPAHHWAFKYIQKVAAAGVAAGCGGGKFCPSAAVDRAAGATLLAKALYGDSFTFPATPYFSDVPSSHWAFKYVQKLAAKSISVGCGNGKYCPTITLTRAQWATLLATAAK